eukprot:m.53053 g.53053  ORF g.53053 m.53053 type:complete len:644 (-) comp12348_c0_seq3:32-1963(-)
MDIPEGQFTATVYNLIKDKRYDEAARILEDQLQLFPESRAAASLLGYCYYQMQEFALSAECYETLVKICPEVEEYKLYLAQALFHSCQYDEAQKASLEVQTSDKTKVTKLQAAIKYEQEDLNGARALLEELPPDSADTAVNEACILYQDGRYAEALGLFAEASQTSGLRAELSYDMALCEYQLKRFANALKHITDIIERGIRDHPELSVGMTTEGIEVRSVGNTKVLRETALVEAFNLKAAIEYQLRNAEAAKEALTDMPPRSESELDPVTLHNMALMNMDEDATGGFEKLQFLLQQNPCPPETFGNLLLLFCKHEQFDLAADILAENPHLTYKYLTQYMYDFLDATLTQQTSPEEAFQKFDDMALAHTESLRTLSKQVQMARHNQNEEVLKKAVNEYDDVLERYVPVLMAQAKIYWERQNYSHVEKIFRKSVEFCHEHDTWKLNVAHVLFMQESKYKEAITFYEPIVRNAYDDILQISPIVLANLCVAYCMTSQNEEAEELMRKIEKEEEALAYDDPDVKSFHLCIVNLVLGTLYCSKGNFQFGISRIIKSLEPYKQKLGWETWFYSKRCLLALIEGMAKHMIILSDNVGQDVLTFLDSCERHGKAISSHEAHVLQVEGVEAGRQTVAYEARYVKSLFLKVM